MASERTKIVVTTGDVVTVPRAAKELGVHHTTIYRWIEKGKIRPFRIGDQVFITIADLEALKEINEQAAESAA